MKKWILQGLAFAGAVALVATVTVTTAAALQDGPTNANGLIGLFTERGTATADTGSPGLRITVLPAPDEEEAEEADHDREGGAEEHAGADTAPETGGQAAASHTEATHEPLSSFTSESTVNTGTTWQVISNTLSATVTVLECPTIDPPEADYDLADPANVSTNITWGDATEIDKIEDDIGRLLQEDLHYTVTVIDDDTATLTILDADDFLGLVLTEPGQELELTIYFDVCDPVTFTITAIEPAVYQAITALTPDRDADHCAGSMASIVEVQDDEGDPVAVDIESYEATLSYDGTSLSVLEVRHDPSFPGDATIDNAAGVTHFDGTATEGMPYPCDLAFLTLRLTGTAEQPVTATLTFSDIRDADGNPIDQLLPAAETTFLRGDANADGTVSISDVLHIAQYLAGIREAGMEEGEVHPVNAASVAYDGDCDRINISDALFIAQYLAGIRGPDYEWVDN